MISSVGKEKFAPAKPTIDEKLHHQIFDTVGEGVSIVKIAYHRAIVR